MTGFLERQTHTVGTDRNNHRWREMLLVTDYVRDRSGAGTE